MLNIKNEVLVCDLKFSEIYTCVIGLVIQLNRQYAPDNQLEVPNKCKMNHNINSELDLK